MIHITLVDARFAARHAIYLPGQQAERYVTIRGVVPGATSQAPVVTTALKIRGQDLTVPGTVPAAISTLNEDVLVDIGTIMARSTGASRQASAWERAALERGWTKVIDTVCVTL